MDETLCDRVLGLEHKLGAFLESLDVFSEKRELFLEAIHLNDKFWFPISGLEERVII